MIAQKLQKTYSSQIVEDGWILKKNDISRINTTRKWTNWWNEKIRLNVKSKKNCGTTISTRLATSILRGRQNEESSICTLLPNNQSLSHPASLLARFTMQSQIRYFGWTSIQGRMICSKVIGTRSKEIVLGEFW